ncbi:hypothetical protein EGW08_013250 [Elysia chlorotica]|uniref:Uncharacterized protein n=1 Tax=Elysia chlorotica TaxID=188477 RepID=A0A3S0ZNE6_ELYCH|nr:hypothetical protein EGW08_013250 [Elysia chlorotica]
MVMNNNIYYKRSFQRAYCPVLFLNNCPVPKAYSHSINFSQTRRLLLCLNNCSKCNPIQSFFHKSAGIFFFVGFSLLCIFQRGVDFDKIHILSQELRQVVTSYA